MISKEKGKLAYGTFSKKQAVFTWVNSSIVAIIWMVLFFIKMFTFIEFVILMTICVFSVAIITSFSLNVARKAEFKFFKNLDINELETSLNNINKEKLHSQTIINLKIILSNYMFMFDLEKGFELFESIDEPTIKPEMAKYQMIKIIYFINKGNKELALKLIEEYNNNKNYPKVFKKSLNNTKDILYSEKEIKDIEKKLLKNTNINLRKIQAYNSLMIYFNVRKNFEKAKYYANKILNLNTKCYEYNKQAEKIINEGEENA